MRGLVAPLLGFWLAASAVHAQTMESGSVEPGRESELARLVKPVNGASTCFARVYSADHLKKHPQQTVTDIRFRLSYIAHKPSPEAPNGERSYLFDMKAKLRKQSAAFDTSGQCAPKAGKIACTVGCDEGGIRVTRRGSDKILIDFGNFGYISNPESCSESPEAEAAARMLKPGTDDSEFLLAKVPLSDCPS